VARPDDRRGLGRRGQGVNVTTRIAPRRHETGTTREAALSKALTLFSFRLRLARARKQNSWKAALPISAPHQEQFQTNLRL
jgi:hypothetical protein